MEKRERPASAPKKKGYQLGVRISDQLRAEIQRIAKRDRRGFSDTARLLIEKGVECFDDTGKF